MLNEQEIYEIYNNFIKVAKTNFLLNNTFLCSFLTFMKINSISRNIILLFMFSQYFILITQTLDNACGIKFCRYCDSTKTPNFCSECDLPYKPVYSNQSVCSRCSNNCLVCKDEGNNSKVECLSC